MKTCELPAIEGRKFVIHNGTKWCDEPAVGIDKSGRNICEYHKFRVGAVKLFTNKQKDIDNPQDESVIAQDKRKPPFAFQIKEALRSIEKNLSGTARAHALSIYLVITWIISDFYGHEEEIKNFRGLVVKKTGLSRPTVSKYIKILDNMKLIKIEKVANKYGRGFKKWKITLKR